MGLLPMWLASPGQRSAGGDPGARRGRNQDRTHPVAAAGVGPVRSPARLPEPTRRFQMPGVSGRPEGCLQRTFQHEKACFLVEETGGPVLTAIRPGAGGTRGLERGSGPGPGARRPRVPEALGCEPREHIPIRQASKVSLREKDTSRAMSFLVSLLPPPPCLNVCVVFNFSFFLVKGWSVASHLYIATCSKQIQVHAHYARKHMQGIWRNI